MHVEPPKKSFRPSRPNDTEPSEEQANFANKNITTLPDELLVKIFSNLDTRDLLNCQPVNRHWQELIDRDHMLALAYYRRCHRAKQPINPLSVERYHSSIRGWLRGFSNLGKESVARLDKFLQHKHFTERLFFSIAKVLAKAKALTCQDVGTITHFIWVDKARFSPDGNYLVTVSWDHSAKISEFVAGRWQEKATIQHSSLLKAGFSPDGKSLVTASYDHTAKIWELEGGQWREKTTLQHSYPVMNASFSPDGRHLVTITNVAKIWELVGDQWQEKATIRHSSQQVATACFSPNGNHLVTIAFDNNIAKIWGLIADQWEQEAEIEFYDYEYEYEGTTIRHSGCVSDVCFSPDGNYLVIAVAEIPTIWEFVDGNWEESAALEHFSLVGNVRFSPDGNHLVTVSYDNTAKIWGAVDDRWLEKATIRHSGSLSITSFSPDGSHLVTVSNSDRTVKIWGLVNGHWQEKITIHHSSSYVSDASFSPDGKHLVMAYYDRTADNTVKILGLVNGYWQEKVTIQHSDRVRGTSFSPDGNHLVTTSDNIAKIWVLRSQENDDSC